MGLSLVQWTGERPTEQVKRQFLEDIALRNWISGIGFENSKVLPESLDAETIVYCGFFLEPTQ